MSESNHRLTLNGCAPIPLASYLKALGILRLVAEQADANVCGFWEKKVFTLRSCLSKRELEEFLLRKYEPSPIITPWNGGSGFYSKSRKAGRKTSIEAIRTSSAGRFVPLRNAINIGHKILKDFGLTEKPDKKQKSFLIPRLRARLSDAAVCWLDTAIVMTSGAEFKCPPLLGSGGNDGNLDFASNYMQHLDELFYLETGEPKSEAEPFLQGALYAKATPNLLKMAIGQFSPGEAGGPNSSTGYEGESRVNPWDFVFMLEGVLLFSGGVARRLEAAGRDKSNLIYPFTVRAAGGGSGAVDTCDESSRGELWLPTWSKPACLDDLKVLFREGRLSVGRRAARDGVDAARAVNGLGVDRGVDVFQRYILAERNGRAYLATPLGDFRVRRNPPRTDLINDLERREWLGSFRSYSNSKEVPANLKKIRRVLDDGLFELSQREREAAAIQQVLISLGKVMAYLTAAQKEREKISPLPRLGWDWTHAADDHSDEYRLAAALAGLCAIQPSRKKSDEGAAGAVSPQGPRGAVQPSRKKPDKGFPFRVHLAALNNSTALRQHPSWEGKGKSEKGDKPDKTERMRTAVWGPRKLVENLVLIAQRRMLIPNRDNEFNPWGTLGEIVADRSAVSAFLNKSTNDERISSLLQGLAWAHHSPKEALEPRTEYNSDDLGYLPFSYTALKPLFTDPWILIGEAKHVKDMKELPVCPPAIPGLLVANNVAAAIREAMNRMRASGFPTPFAKQESSLSNPLTGQRLLAALLIPVERRVVKACLTRTYPYEDPPTGG